MPGNVRLLRSVELEIFDPSAAWGSSEQARGAAMRPAPDEGGELVVCKEGAHVVRGQATGVVFARKNSVAPQGLKIAWDAWREASQHGTDGLKQVGQFLLAWMGVLAVVVFLVTICFQGRWLESLLFALATAVGLTPELLPLMVNINLARAAWELMGHGVFCKTLPVLSRLGGIELLAVEPNGLDVSEEWMHKSSELGVNVKLLTGLPMESVGKMALRLGCRGKLADWKQWCEACESSGLSAFWQEHAGVAGLSPVQKAEILRVLHGEGMVVGFVGSGPEDAPALRVVGVGVAAANAAPLARNCASVVLHGTELEAVWIAAVQARRAVGNSIKFACITASSNLGNALSALVAVAFLPFLPMRGIQMLVQSVLYDLAQLPLAWDAVDEEYLKTPRRFSPASMARMMAVFAPLSSVFDAITFWALGTLFGAGGEEGGPLFHTGWFLVGLLTQLGVVQILRTQEDNLLKNRAHSAVLGASLAAAATRLLLPFSAAGAALGLVPLPVEFFRWVGAVLLLYGTSAIGVKKWYVRKWGGLF